MSKKNTISDTKKIWRVTIERDIMVVADGQAGAEREALRNEREECYNTPTQLYARHVTQVSQVPEGWHDGYPYGDEALRTCAELLGVETEASPT